MSIKCKCLKLNYSKVENCSYIKKIWQSTLLNIFVHIIFSILWIIFLGYMSMIKIYAPKREILTFSVPWMYIIKLFSKMVILI